MTNAHVPLCCAYARCRFRGTSTEGNERLPRLAITDLDIKGRYNFGESCAQSFGNGFLRGKSPSKTHDLISRISKACLLNCCEATVHKIALLIC